MTFTFRPILTALTLLGLVILLGLGNWQWQKVGPKTDLIDRIKTGLNGDARPLWDVLAGVDTVDLRYQRVSFEGSFIAGTPLRLAGVSTQSKSGYHLYGVFNPDGVEIPILVSTGWIPFDTKDLPAFEAGRTQVSGVLIGPGTKGSFTPENDVGGNLWYWADFPAMAATFDTDTVNLNYRVILDDKGGDLPIGGQVRLDIPNDHFEYALTWWGLGLTLIGVYGAFSLRRRES